MGWDSIRGPVSEVGPPRPPPRPLVVAAVAGGAQVRARHGFPLRLTPYLEAGFWSSLSFLPPLRFLRLDGEASR